MGGSTTVQAPDAADSAKQALQAQVDISPQQYASTSEYAPKYSDLYSNIANSSLFGDANSQGLLSTYAAAAPILQGIQTSANNQQAQGNIDLVTQLGGQAVQAYQNANPQLVALQKQLSTLAGTPQNPVSMLGGVPQANAGYNGSASMLNNVAQQQLALGTSVSPQQASTLSGQVLANYNAQGRANDPTAIAGLATSLDSYGQQLLGQREQNAATAANTYAQQQQLGLGAQGTNIASMLQSGAQNQYAQLSNANYQSSLLTTAANLANASAVNPYQMILGQSGALGAASGATGQAEGSANAGSQLANMYNPFTNGAFSTVYGGQLDASKATASNNAAITGAAIGAAGSVAGGAASAM